MTYNNDHHVKILVSFFSDILDEWIVEKLWAETIDSVKGYYKIDNIPFYAAIACGDIVHAEYDETEKMLTYRETNEYSGNSLVQVVLLDKSKILNDIRETFNLLECMSEKLNDGYFAMDIPARVDYRVVKQKLCDLSEIGIIDYAEPVLSDKHQY